MKPCEIEWNRIQILLQLLLYIVKLGRNRFVQFNIKIPLDINCCNFLHGKFNILIVTVITQLLF